MNKLIEQKLEQFDTLWDDHGGNFLEHKEFFSVSLTALYNQGKLDAYENVANADALGGETAMRDCYTVNLSHIASLKEKSHAQI